MTVHLGSRSQQFVSVLIAGCLASTLCCGIERSPNTETVGGSGDGTGGTVAGNNGVTVLLTECPPGQVRCEGDVAISCGASGGMGRDCGAEGYECLPPFGCVVCSAGEGTCEDNLARHCNAQGTGYEQFECDPLQGMVCEQGGCTGACSPVVLQDGYVGCDYYPTVTANPVFGGFQFAVAVANAGTDETSVEITQADAVIAAATIQPGDLQVLSLPWIDALKGGDQDSCQNPPGALPTTLVQAGAYRLRSTSPVSVYQFNPLRYQLNPSPPSCPLRNDCPGSPPRPDEGCLSFSNDATLLFPVNVLTESYSVMSWPSTAAGQGFASVVATQDATEVQVMGRGLFVPGSGVDTDGMGTVTLDQGDVLQLMAAPGANRTYGSDISGTVIFASAPIQVIGGSSCAHIPEATTNACDHIEHAMLPEETLGKDYLLSFPAAPGSESPQIVRILPTVDNTTLLFEPELPSVGARVVRSPEQGPLQLSVTADFRVLADNPILVVHYLQGQQSVDSGAGDPSMAVAVPVAQYRDDYIFSVSDTYDDNFINVVVLSDTTVQLNGEELLASNFSPVGNTAYQVQRLPLPKGTEVFRMEGSRPFGVVVYGYGKFTSYLYPAGLDLKKIAPARIR